MQDILKVISPHWIIIKCIPQSFWNIIFTRDGILLKNYDIGDENIIFVLQIGYDILPNIIVLIYRKTLLNHSLKQYWLYGIAMISTE